MTSLYTFAGAPAGVAQAISFVSQQLGGQIANLRFAVMSPATGSAGTLAGGASAITGVSTIADLQAALTDAAPSASNTILIWTMELSIGIGMGPPAAAPDPSTIPGLSLWLDGRTASAFSDAAGTVPATATGRVRRVNQAAPLTGSWLSASDPLRILREAQNSAFDVPGGSTSIVAPAGAALPANNATVGFSFTRRDPRANGAEYVLVGNDGVFSWGLYCSNNNLHVFYQGFDFDTGISCLMNTPVTGVVRWSPTGIDVLCDVGGVSRTASASGTLTARSTASLTIGFNTDNSFNPFIGAGLVAVISQLTGHQRAISDAERTTLMTWLLAHKAPTTFPTNAPLIMLEGDSIATTVLQFFTKDAWCMQMLPNLWGTADVRLEDVAVSGSTIANVADRYTTTVLPFLSASRTRNIVILAVGTNSLGPGTQTPAQVLADLYSLADVIRVNSPAGTKLICQTILPREVGSFGASSNFESDRSSFNTLLRGSYTLHFDAIADIATILHMGAFGDSANTTYYQDGTHPTVTGETLLEPTYRAAVLSFLP